MEQFSPLLLFRVIRYPKGRSSALSISENPCFFTRPEHTLARSWPRCICCCKWRPVVCARAIPPPLCTARRVLSPNEQLAACPRRGCFNKWPRCVLLRNGPPSVGLRAKTSSVAMLYNSLPPSTCSSPYDKFRSGPCCVPIVPWRRGTLFTYFYPSSERHTL